MFDWEYLYSFVPWPLPRFPLSNVRALPVPGQKSASTSATKRPRTPPPRVNSKPLDEARFRVFDFDGKRQLQVGACCIQDYKIDPARWGLTEGRDSTSDSEAHSGHSPPITRSKGKGKTPLKRRLSDSEDGSSPSKRQKLESPGPAPAALELLRPPRKVKAPQYSCLQCGNRPNSTKCTIDCYHAFRAVHFTPAAAKLQIKQTAPGPHATGFGVFVLSDQFIPADTWLGQYLGELLPPNAPEVETSDYAFDMPGRAVEHVRKVVVDASTHGNWTRFVNSSCEPNVQATPEQVGKVRIIAFRAIRDIQGGEQILVSYGRGYFEEREILCCCEAKREPHLPLKRWG